MGDKIGRRPRVIAVSWVTCLVRLRAPPGGCSSPAAAELSGGPSSVLGTFQAAAPEPEPEPQGPRGWQEAQASSAGAGWLAGRDVGMKRAGGQSDRKRPLTTSAFCFHFYSGKGGC